MAERKVQRYDGSRRHCSIFYLDDLLAIIDHAPENISWKFSDKNYIYDDKDEFLRKKSTLQFPVELGWSDNRSVLKRGTLKIDRDYSRVDNFSNDGEAVFELSKQFEQLLLKGSSFFLDFLGWGWSILLLAITPFFLSFSNGHFLGNRYLLWLGLVGISVATFAIAHQALFNPLRLSSRVAESFFDRNRDEIVIGAMSAFLGAIFAFALEHFSGVSQ